MPSLCDGASRTLPAARLSLSCGKQMSAERKLEVYPHIYSYSSGESGMGGDYMCFSSSSGKTCARMCFVVHPLCVLYPRPSPAPLSLFLPLGLCAFAFFARTRQVKCVVHWFQMMYSGRLSMFADGPASQYVPVTYDVARVACPVAIVYGGSDHLGEPLDVPAVISRTF